MKKTRIMRILVANDTLNAEQRKKVVDQIKKRLPELNEQWYDYDERSVSSLPESSLKQLFDTLVLDQEVQLILVVTGKGKLACSELDTDQDKQHFSHKKCREITTPDSELSIHCYATVKDDDPSQREEGKPSKRTLFFDALVNSELGNWCKELLVPIEQAVMDMAA